MDRAINTPWWRRGTSVAALATVLTLAGAGAGAAVLIAKTKSTLRVSATSVRTGVARTGEFHDIAPIRATVAPLETLTLDAQEGGQTVEILARSGDMVAAGQPLVRFRNPDLELQVLDRQASLISQIAALQDSARQIDDTSAANAREAANTAYDIGRLTTTYQRQQALFASGVTTAVALSQARDELALAQSLQPLQAQTQARAEALRTRRLPEIDDQLAILRQTLEATKARLDGLVVRAPVAGRLSDFTLTVGETKARGEAIGGITPDTGFKLTAPVDAYYLGRVRAGQGASFTLASLGAVTALAAQVSRVDPQVKAGNFTIELEFTSPPPLAQMTAGQILEGRLALGGDKPALVAPAGPWLDTAGGAWAMVLSPDGAHADKRAIKIGQHNAEEVEILAGLKPGEAIVTSGYETYDKIERLQISK